MITQNKVGILSPFRRDQKSDIANGSGEELLKSKVIQAIMTEGETPYSAGELPFRTNFGGSVELLRHQSNNNMLVELARVYVRDALKKWVPEVELVDIEAVRNNEILKLRITFKSFQNTIIAEVEM